MKYYLSILESHFNEHGWPTDVNAKKLFDRGCVAFDDDNGNPIIEIERHRACLGAQYIRGLKMSAYQTYWMRYEIDGASLSVRELPERNGLIDVDACALANELLESDSLSLNIENENNVLTIIEITSGECRVVSTLGEVEDFVLSIAQMEIDYFAMSLGNFSDELEQDYQSCVDEYKNVLCDGVLEKARNVWALRESE